jgi:hypothetical protein
LKVSGLGVPDLPLVELYHIEFDVVKSLGLPQESLGV